MPAVQTVLGLALQSLDLQCHLYPQPRFTVLNSRPHAGRYFGEALRALLVLETRGLHALVLTPLDRPPPHLPAGTGAVRVEVRTPSAARCAVTLGGPPELLKNKVWLERGFCRHAAVVQALDERCQHLHSHSLTLTPRPAAAAHASLTPPD